jgi:hypothetical protein
MKSETQLQSRNYKLITDTSAGFQASKYEIRRLYKISNKYNTINKHSMPFNNSPGQ